jgi:uncharacterized delta-60 repeat protein
MKRVRRGACLVVPIVCVLAAWTAGPAIAAAGSLDPSFGGDGKVRTNFTIGFDNGAGVLIQPADGKVVVAGSSGDGRFALARYLHDGTLDPTFGSGGRVTTPFHDGAGANAVAVQANGEIVAAGGTGGIHGRFAVARYDADGALDHSFGGDGKVSTDFTNGKDSANAVVVQDDGKVVVAGGANNSAFALARYRGDGSLDHTFGGDGKVTTRFPLGGGSAFGLALQSDGRLVAAGALDFFGFAVARYRPNGQLDPTFSGDGRAQTIPGDGESSATSVAIQGDGKIVAAGYTDVPHEGGDTFGPGRFAVVRYNPNGKLDRTFGGDGKVKTRFREGAAANAVAVRGRKIVAAGHRNLNAFALARYNANGTLDRTFGGDGKVTTKFDAGETVANGMTIGGNGRIVAAGRTGTDARFAVARYLAA